MTMKKTLYLILAFWGLVLPYVFFIRFVIENGIDASLLLSQLFANNISTFFAIDLVITAIVLIVWMRHEAKRLTLPNWWAYVIATLMVGPSFALPLFLYVRERRIHTA